MYELDRIVNTRYSATVVDARPVVTLAAPYHRRADLIAQVRRQAARGEIRPLTARPSYNTGTGLWEQRVLLTEPPIPGWVRPVAIACAVLAGLGIFVTLLWWVLASLAAAPLALFLLAALGALTVITRAGRKKSVTIINNVSQR